MKKLNILTVDLACSILIFLYMMHELSYDDFHEKSDNIYRIAETIIDDQGNLTENSASVPWSVGPTLKNDFPRLTITHMYQAWQKDPLISTPDKEKVSMLIGLVTYRVNTRVHEIGIRKILGASEQGIVGLLSKEFIVLVILANVVALPLSWYLMNYWLKIYS